MNWPDLPLREETDLIFRHPRAEPPEGLVVVRLDLAAFFDLAERIGQDEALVLLVIKALRTRYGPFRLRMYDLAWRMRTGNRRVNHWLDRLARHGLIVYTIQDLFEKDTVEVEIVGAPTGTLFQHHALHVLPTHWVEHALPLLGRRSFLVLLFLVSAEDRAAFHMDHLVRAVGLRGRWHATWHLRRLRRHGVLQQGRDGGGLIVTDPPQPSRLQQLRLRFLRQPYLRSAFLQIAALALLLALLLAGLVALHRLS
jgi:hypothetical protein